MDEHGRHRLLVSIRLAPQDHHLASESDVRLTRMQPYCLYSLSYRLGGVNDPCPIPMIGKKSNEEVMTRPESEQYPSRTTRNPLWFINFYNNLNTNNLFFHKKISKWVYWYLGFDSKTYKMQHPTPWACTKPLVCRLVVVTLVPCGI